MVGEMELLLVRERGQRPGTLMRVDDEQVHGIGSHVEHAKPHTMTLQPGSLSADQEEPDVPAASPGGKGRTGPQTGQGLPGWRPRRRYPRTAARLGDRQFPGL